MLVECTLIRVDVACNDNTMYLSTYRIYDIINAKRDTLLHQNKIDDGLRLDKKITRTVFISFDNDVFPC